MFDDTQPCDAGVLYVWDSRRINIEVTGPSGAKLALQGVQLVQLVQGNDAVADGDSYAAWMGYQIAQAT